MSEEGLRGNEFATSGAQYREDQLGHEITVVVASMPVQSKLRPKSEIFAIPS